jgi:hypothetical protein
VYFLDIWAILQLFGTFYGQVVYFPHFGMFYYETSGNPAYLSKRLKNSIRILFLFNFHPSLLSFSCTVATFQRKGDTADDMAFRVARLD